MKNTTKKIAVLVLAVCFMLSTLTALCGCAEFKQNAIVGKWYDENMDYIEVFSDNTFILESSDFDSEHNSGAWRYIPKDDIYEFHYDSGNIYYAILESDEYGQFINYSFFRSYYKDEFPQELLSADVQLVNVLMDHLNEWEYNYDTISKPTKIMIIIPTNTENEYLITTADTVQSNSEYGQVFSLTTSSLNLIATQDSIMEESIPHDVLKSINQALQNADLTQLVLDWDVSWSLSEKREKLEEGLSRAKSLLENAGDLSN